MNYDSFRSFCLNFKNTKIKNDIHFLPQTEMLTYNGKIDVDIIYKFEDRETMYKDLKDKLNIECDNNVHIYSTKDKNSNFLNFYDNEMLDIIYEVYKDDFINFGYEKINI